MNASDPRPSHATGRIAFTRAVSSRIAECELTHLDRQPVDAQRAQAQHAVYEAALRDCGCEVRRLTELEECPDGVFVEDTVVVLDECAVLTRPGAASRQPEVDTMAEALSGLRPCVRLREPATLDGGDVLVVGRRIYVGASARSNAAGMAALADAVREFGYSVHTVPQRNCLHLKTAVTLVGDDLLLLDPHCVDAAHFEGVDVLAIDPTEPFAANALRISGRVIYPQRFVRTADRLRERDIDLFTVAADELAKAEGGVTCCSVVFRVMP